MTRARTSCVGAILAGGQSSRLGGAPKGLATIGSQRMVDRAANALRAATDTLLIASNAPAAATWVSGASVVGDVRAGFGAISGMHAAIAWAAAVGRSVLTLPWDMPFVPGGLLVALRDAGELESADLAVPRSNSPWGFEPLCAWFAPTALPIMEAMLDSGEARAAAMRDRARCVVVDVSSFGEPDDIFLNVNTPEDLTRAMALAAALDRAEAARTGGPR